jgi:hypothetical protein
MTTTEGPNQEPLWLAIEKRILELGSHDLAADNLENVIQGLARDLDAEGRNISKNAGHMLAVRRAVEARASAGHSMMADLNSAFDALTLDDLTSPYAATLELVRRVGGDWPALLEAERRPHLVSIVEDIRLDLLVKRAEEAGGEKGIRLLMAERIPAPVIVERMGISQEEYDRVLAAVKAEEAERNRVRGLLKDVQDRTDAEKIRHLINSDVAEDLMVEMAGVDPSAIDEVKKAMEEEIAEKKRLAEEEAARKAAEAAGPALEDIPPDEMLEHIEALREILEFSDVEKEIRVMCEQSSVPAALVDIAISEPDRLDELEAEAEG